MRSGMWLRRPVSVPCSGSWATGSPHSWLGLPEQRGQNDAKLVTLLESGRTIEERAQVFSAMERHRQSKIIREAAKIISSTTWGKQLSPYAQAAIAQYALSCGTDPVRHWEVLGGKLYDTAALWLDIAASAADYNGYGAEDLTWSDDLTAEERDRRKTERARWGLPQDVAGACVVRIYRKGIDRPFVGANHAGNRRTYRAEKLEIGRASCRERG